MDTDKKNGSCLLRVFAKPRGGRGQMPGSTHAANLILIILFILSKSLPLCCSGVGSC